MAKLKVFRTPIGFHDAYVAAPSQKAALEAWGAGTNLFAAGAAELVTDSKLIEEPLANPGKVIRKVRGSEEEHVRALGKKPKAKRNATEVAEPKKKRSPRPSRAAVDKAERALETAEARHSTTIEKLKAEEEKLEKRRRELERKRRKELEQLQEKVDAARERYRTAMAEWAD